MDTEQSSPANEIMIPILPCRSINETLEFYRALGFEVTYQQSKPNTYAVVSRGGIELHFFSMREYEPAQSYSTCYVRVSDVDGLYQAFVAGLRQAYGRPPTAGIPRVIPLKNKSGRREFIVVDPGGNWIRIGQIIEMPAGNEDPAPNESKAVSAKLSRALHAAMLLSDAGHDDRAAKMLDAALVQDEPASITQRVQALVFRAGLAINLGDLSLARSILLKVRQIPLPDDDRQTLVAELQRVDELEYMLP